MATGGDQDSVRHVNVDAAVGGKMPAMCGPCGRTKKTTPASVLCSTCDAHLCRECCRIHQIHVPGEHVFSSIQDDKEGHVLIDLQGLDCCEEHNRAFVYVCKDHDALVCDECLFYQHRKCDDINKLTEMTPIEDVSGPVTELRNKMSSGSDLLEKCEMHLQGIEGRRDEIVRHFDQQKVEMSRRFDEAKTRVLEELDAHDASDISRLQGVKCGVEAMRTNVQKMVSLHESVEGNGTEAEKFIINFACKKKDTQITNKLDELKINNYSVSLKLTWNKQIQNFINSDDLVAHLQVTPSIVDDDLSAFDNESGIDFPIVDCNLTDLPASEKSPNFANYSGDSTSQLQTLPEDDVPRPVTLTLKARLDLVKADGDEQLPFVTGLAFIDDGRIAAVDLRNRLCFIMNAGLQRLGSGFRFQDKPYDIVCFMENNLAVTQKNSIAILSVSVDGTLTLSNTITTSFNCSSISHMHDDTFLVCTLEDHQTVRTIDTHGNEGDIEHLRIPDKTYTIDNSACCYIPSSQAIVFSDKEQGTVYICGTMSGEGHETVDAKIPGPKGVCAGPLGTAFVCSEYTQSIVQISPNGEVLKSHSVDMGCPRAVAISKDGSRLVVSNSTHGQKMIKFFIIE